MSDDTCHRRLTYRLYPNESQLQRLRHLKWCHKELYNALVQQRREAWRRRRETLSYRGHQSEQITALRNATAEELGREDNPWADLNAQSLHATAQRVEAAFQHFFRKCRDPSFSGNPGYPRFKSFHRYNGWTYKQNGWKLSRTPTMPTGTPDVRQEARQFVADGHKNGHLYLQEVGTMQVRGHVREGLRMLAARGQARVKRLTLLDKADGWYLSVVLECDEQPARDREDSAAVGVDWGIETFATLVQEGVEDAREAVQEIANPRVLQQAEQKLKRLQRELARKRESGSHGGNSNRYRKLRSKLARAHQDVARKRKDFLHKVTTYLVVHFALIATEDLDVLNLTASARGTEEDPGSNVKQKAGLNRRILDTAPGTFMRLLATKAEEAGSRVEAYDPRQCAPTQTCCRCGYRHEGPEKHALADRTVTCQGCGAITDRDENAARVLLNWALHGSASGRGPAGRGGGDNGPDVPESPPPKREVHRAA